MENINKSISNILEIKDLCKTYPKSGFTLNNVNMALPKGAIMGFVGENGAGKTTTINCLLQTLVPDSGSIQIFGQDFHDDSIWARDEIGVVYDSNCFGASLNAKSIAHVMGSVYSKWDKPLFQAYLRRFQLKEKQIIKEYSRGMTMKLSLAVALAHHPRLLIMDEATGGLDPIVRDEVLDILLDFVQDEEHSVLLSSHITSDLDKIADYICFIHEGNILLCESKENLLVNYGLLRLKTAQFAQIEKEDIIAVRKHDLSIDVLVTNQKKAQKKYPDVVIDQVSTEEVMLLLVKGEKPL